MIKLFLRMEFLTNSLQEFVAGLSEDQKAEIDIIESIINTNNGNKEDVKEKVFLFLDKKGPIECVNFILHCIEHAATIRPRERESFLFLVIAIFEKYQLYMPITKNYQLIRGMLEEGKIVPETEDKLKGFRSFLKFSEEGTIGRAIFDDDVNMLQQLLTDRPKGDNIMPYRLKYFYHEKHFPFNHGRKIPDIKLIEVAAIFGSACCFKYLMLNGQEINERMCVFAIAGGNYEIIDICEQRELKFTDCLLTSAVFHRFELFERLNSRFEYPELLLADLISSFNEPLFYFYVPTLDVEKKDVKANTPIVCASRCGEFEVVKHLYEKYHADYSEKGRNGRNAINNAAKRGHLDVIRYLNETCHINPTESDYEGNNPISNAVDRGYFEALKYLYEKSNVAVVDVQDRKGYSNVSKAIINGHFEILRYLCETCNANHEVPDKQGWSPIHHAVFLNKFEVVKYLCETCHVRIIKKNKEGKKPYDLAIEKGYTEIAAYLKEKGREEYCIIF